MSVHKWRQPCTNIVLVQIGFKLCIVLAPCHYVLKTTFKCWMSSWMLWKTLSSMWYKLIETPQDLLHQHYTEDSFKFRVKYHSRIYGCLILFWWCSFRHKWDGKISSFHKLCLARNTHIVPCYNDLFHIYYRRCRM